MKKPFIISLSLDPSMDKNLAEYLAEVNAMPNVTIHLDLMRASMVGHDRCTPEQCRYVLENARHPVDVHWMAKEPPPPWLKDSAPCLYTHPKSAVDIDAPIEDADAETVVVMCVKAGKSGQVFNPAALKKIKQLRKKYPSIRIIVDGGINSENIEIVKRAGADTAVIGNFIYCIPSRAQRIQAAQELFEIANK